MENWGLITYLEEVLLYEEGVSSLLDKETITEMIAHELAHQVREEPEEEPGMFCPFSSVFLFFFLCFFFFFHSGLETW